MRNFVTAGVDAAAAAVDVVVAALNSKHEHGQMVL